MPGSAESAHRMFRPPAEKNSLLLRVADGCPHNTCAFCGMYRGVRYRVWTLSALEERIAELALQAPQTRRIFLADGDALALSMPKLLAVLALVQKSFPRLARVNCYASGRSVAMLTDDELRMLRAARLHTLYMGLESGSETVLRRMGKRDTAADMILACQRAQAVGLGMSVMVLLGLGGVELSAEHVRESVRAVNALQPKLLSCLRVVPVPGTSLWSWVREGRFTLLSEAETVRELYDFVAGLELTGTVFRADHSSNCVPVAGRLPADMIRLLEELRAALEAGVLDDDGPGAQSIL